MQTKKRYLFPAVFLIMVVGIFAVYNFNPVPIPEGTGGHIEYNSMVCISKNDEVLQCSPNVLYNDGKDIVRDMLLGSGGATNNVTNMSLCNASVGSAGCEKPVAAATETFTYYDACGLTEAPGTTGALANGNYSVWHQWTSSCDGRLVNATRLGNWSDNFAGLNFSLVTLDNGDKLTVNWTIYIT